MSTRTSRHRRNGKLEACEPCRRQKIRCDHGLPKCARCKRRNLECSYHPAPLTRGATGLSPETVVAEVFGTPSSSAPIAPTASAASVSHTPSITPASPEPESLPTFLGQSSFADVLKTDYLPDSNKQWVQPLLHQVKRSQRHLGAVPFDLTATPFLRGLYEERIAMGAHVLRLLEDYVAIKDALYNFIPLCNIIACPDIIPVNLLNSLELILPMLGSAEKRRQLAAQVFTNTASPMNICRSTTAQNLHEFCTGPKLRWEVIGYIYALSALALGLLRFLPSTYRGEHGDSGRAKWTLELAHAGDIAIQYAQELDSLTDISLWAQYLSVCQFTYTYGDNSFIAWRRLGDLASTISAMGVHEQPTNTDLPFFITETRRRLFAYAYSTGQGIATFLGRPPHISVSYCSCLLPLDLTDEEIMAPEEIRSQAIANLDPDGWNTKGGFYRATNARSRLIMAKVREKALKISLGPETPDREQQARALLTYSAQAWQSIPSFARYSDECWSSKENTVLNCFTKLFQYIKHLYDHFLLHRVLACRYGEPRNKIVEASQELLAAISTLSRYRGRSKKTHLDFACEYLSYGLPAAALLALELLRAKRQPSPETASLNLPPGETIRNISVFITSLHWIAEPEDGNYPLCQAAKAMLERIVDAIVSAEPVSQTDMPTTADTAMGNSVDGQPGFPAVTAGHDQLDDALQDPATFLDDFFGEGWMAGGPAMGSFDVSGNGTSWLDWPNPAFP